LSLRATKGPTKVKLEHETWVVVADGEKYLLLRNIGDEEYPRLEVVDHDKSENPPARELSTDRSGRMYDAARQRTGGVAAWGKSGMEETDWHKVAEERFAEEITVKLRQLASSGRFQKLVVIADPRTLGTMRNGYDDELRSLIVAEVAKDLTNLPLVGIEASIKAY
jgi:protein required for attachment to host cells